MAINNVAVIGGGVSGLGAAYFLNMNGVAVTVYEAVHKVGGNCRTVDVEVGQAVPGGQGKSGSDSAMNRWVDIGVNDFNKNSYANIVQMLDMLGVPYAPLEDTISFSGVGNGDSIPGSGYTMDNMWANTIPENIEMGSKQFADYLDNNIDEFLTVTGKFYIATIGDFLTDPDINSQYSELNMTSDFVKYNLFPHINAMYFANNVQPSEMPARTVIHYFNLQEGYGTGKSAERMYFKNGSQDWIQALKTHLTSNGVVINESTTAQVSVADDGVTVSCNGASYQYDAAVLGVQAWQLSDTFVDEPPDYIKDIEEGILYSKDEVVIHSWTGDLPTNVSAWRTYNVNMYQDTDEPQTYRMTYIINRHQNDVNNSDYNFATDPQCFCSLNPMGNIPAASYLKGPASVPEGCTMFHFYHTILDMKAQAYQDSMIPGVQGWNNIWLVGGYTCGTGLLEECWEAVRNVVAKMMDPSHEFDHIYNREKSGRDGIPLHIRKRLI